VSTVVPPPGVFRLIMKIRSFRAASRRS